MKKLILSATAVLFSIGAFAQTGFGLKAGVNLPKYHYSNENNDNTSDTKMSTNFHITGYADLPVSPNFAIQPGVSLQGKGAKLYDGDDLQVTQNTMWIEVPVNAVAKFPTMGDGHFFLGAGPYAAFGISGKNKWETDNGSVENDLPEFEFGDDGQKGFDAGINLLAGYQLGSGLNLGVGYGFGLVDLDGSENIKQNNRVLSFSVGFAL